MHRCTLSAMLHGSSYQCLTNPGLIRDQTAGCGGSLIPTSYICINGRVYCTAANISQSSEYQSKRLEKRRRRSIKGIYKSRFSRGRRMPRYRASSQSSPSSKYLRSLCRRRVYDATFSQRLSSMSIVKVSRFTFVLLFLFPALYLGYHFLCGLSKINTYMVTRFYLSKVIINHLICLFFINQ